MPCSISKIASIRATASTTDHLVVAQGSVDLGAKTVDLQMEAHAKDLSLIDIDAPVAISGPLVDPSISIGEMDSLPFFEIGEDNPVDCDILANAA